MIIEIVLGLICLLLAWNFLKKPETYPPGNWGFPLIGYIPLNGRSFKEQVFELKKKHNSNVVIWKMGSQIMVFVFTYKLIKETLSRMEFINRPDLKIMKMCSEDWENFGLTFRNGQGWHNGRRFSLRLLKDLGMGKSKLVSDIQSEARELVNELKKTGPRSQPLPRALAVAAINVIWQMTASKKFSSNDEELVELEELISELQRNFVNVIILDFFPWLIDVIPSFMLKKILKINYYYEFRRKIKEFMLRHVKEHEATLNPDDPRDYIDYYLLEMKEQESDVNSTMSTSDLLECCADLFTAGSETTKATLVWALYYLANHQDIQTRLQREVDDVLPKGTLGSLDEKIRMPYTEAVIYEALRLSSFTPFGVMHEATQNVEIEGYLIPKGAIINPVFLDCHFGKDIWDSPEEFRPERFLDSEGKFVKPKNGFIAFGSGRRKCLGESLARMELFIFLTTIVQSLAFSPPPGKLMDVKPVSGNPISSIPNEHQDIVISLR